MGPWNDCSGRLLMNAVPVEKKTPLPSNDIIEKIKACFRDPYDGPWLESMINGATIDADRCERAENNINCSYEKERKESMNTNYLDTAVHFRNGSYISVTAFNHKTGTIPEVKLIQRRGRCTIVKWEDGTETKVVLEEGKPDTGIFGAYCIALAKKCAGSTDKLLRTIDDHDERVLKCRHLAKMQELREKRLKRLARERKLKWENDVAAAMYDSRVRDEAIKRLWAKEKKEEL